MMAKTKLGGLVSHRCDEATGIDLTPTLSCVDVEEGCVCQTALRISVYLLLDYVSACAHGCACFPSWQCLLGIIHGTHPISRSAYATHVFLFNLLVFSSSATTRTLPAIFFPAQDKRITDVRGWNEPSPPLPTPPSPPPVL